LDQVKICWASAFQSSCLGATEVKKIFVLALEDSKWKQASDVVPVQPLPK